MDFEELRGNIKKIKDDPSQIHYFTAIVDELDLEMGRDLLEEVAAFAKKEQMKEAYGWATHRLGWIYQDLMKFKTSIEYHMISHDTFVAIGDVEGIIAGSNGLMADYATQELWDLAIEWALKGMELAEKNQKDKALTALLINTAIIYVKLEKYTKSKEMLDQVNKIAYPLSIPDKVAKYTVEALSELGIGNVGSAVEFIEKAYEGAKSTNNMNLADILSGRGKIYTKIGNYKVAEKCFMEGFSFAKNNNQPKYGVMILIEWAKLDISREHYQEAIEKLFNAANQIGEIQARGELKDIYFNLSKAYKGLKKLEESLIYMEKYLEMKEQIISNQSEAWMARLDYKKAQREAIIYKTLYNQIEHLSSLGQKITATLKLEDVINIVSEEIKYMFNADVFELSLYAQEESKLECVLCIEDGQKINKGDLLAEENNLSNYCIKNKESILLNDIAKEYNTYLLGDEDYIERLQKRQGIGTNNMPQSALVVPLILKDRVSGVISIQSYEKRAYTQKDLSALRILGSYIAIALENTQLFKEVEYRAAYDALTQIYNRSEIIRRGIEVYENEKEIMCLIMIDVDDFKNVNDTYGHVMGDQVLRKVARTMKKSVREGDLIGRYGGEEFLIVLPHTATEEAYIIAEKIRRDVERLELEYSESEELKISISAGITSYPGLGNRFEEIIKCADKALYRSKEQGKNQINIYE